jgi:hypothetical protein
LVNALGKTVNTKMWGEKPRIVFFTVRVHMGLEKCHCVGVVGVQDSTEEDTTPSTIGVVIEHLALEAKEQEVCLGKVEHVIAVGPLRWVDGYDGVEARHIQLENAPKVIVVVVWLTPHGCQRYIHAR